jgi:hypothetical protein
VGFEVLTAVVMTVLYSGNTKPYSFVLQAGFLLGLLFGPEEDDDMFLRSFGWFSPDYMASYARRQDSSCHIMILEE